MTCFLSILPTEHTTFVCDNSGERNVGIIPVRYYFAKPKYLIVKYNIVQNE